MARTKGLSPKVTGPFVAAASAFAVAKIEDPPTEALVVAAIGVAAAIILPAGEQTNEPGPIKKVVRKVKKPKPQVIEPIPIVPPNPDAELMT